MCLSGFVSPHPSGKEPLGSIFEMEGPLIGPSLSAKPIRFSQPV